MTSDTPFDDDELLSAYVDGELTPAERAGVEERLRSDPRAARLVEELRRLSSAVRALPRQSLGRDLRASVEAELRRREAEAPAVLPMIRHDRWANIRRGLAWSAVTAAAALLLAFLGPQDGARDDADLAKAKRASSGEGRENNRRLGGEGGPRPMGEMRAAPEVVGGAMGTEGSNVPESGADRVAGSAAPATEAPAIAVEDEEAKQRSVQLYADLPASEPAIEPFAADKSPAAAEPPAAVQPPGSNELPAAAAASEYAMSRPRVGDLLEPTAPLAPAAPAGAGGAAAAPRPSEPTATIELAFRSPAGMERFHRLLAEHDVALESAPPATAAGEPAAVAADSASRPDDAATEGAATQPAEAVAGAKAEQAEQAEQGESAVESLGRFVEENAAAKVKESADEPMEAPAAVLVEAPPEVIESLVAAIAAEEDAFAAVGAVGAASGGERYHYFGYRRQRLAGARGAAPRGGEAEEGGRAIRADEAPAAAPQEAATAADGESPPRREPAGWAWFLSDVERAGDFSKAVEGDSAPLQGEALDAGAAPTTTGAAGGRLVERDAAVKDAPAPAAGRVRVLFVLRPPADVAPAKPTGDAAP